MPDVHMRLLPTSESRTRLDAEELRDCRWR